MKTQQILKNLNLATLPTYVNQLILFGSEAYGKPNLLSDIDIAVVTERPLTVWERAAVWAIVDDLETVREVQLTFVVPVAQKPLERFDVRRDIFEKGLVLYEK